MPEKKETYPGGIQSVQQTALQAPPTRVDRVLVYPVCGVGGRPRAYMRRFALCRICFRERALVGELPGVTKSSW